VISLFVTETSPPRIGHLKRLSVVAAGCWWLSAGSLSIGRSVKETLALAIGFGVCGVIAITRHSCNGLADFFPRVLLIICTIAFGFVGVTSLDHMLSQAGVAVVTMIGLALVAQFPVLTSDTRGDDMQVPMFAFSALVLQGWVFLLPITIAVIVVRIVWRHLRHVARFFIGIPLVVLGVIASRLMGAGDEHRFFVTFDQLYRASMASSLTQWGWSDWNALAGTRIRYHWLAEASAGITSVVSGIDVFDAVSGVWPLFNMLCVVSALAIAANAFTMSFGQPLLVLIVAAFSYQLEFSSIGTMLGTTLFVLSLSQLPHIFDPVIDTFTLRRAVASATMPVVLLPMAQSTTGVMFLGILALLYCRRCFTLPRALHYIGSWILGIASWYAFLAATLLAGGPYGATRFRVAPDWIPPFFGPEWIGNMSLRAGSAVFIGGTYWWFLWGPVLLSALLLGQRKQSLAPWVAAGASLTAVSFIILVRLGGFEYRLAGEMTFIIVFFVLGILISYIAGNSPVRLTLLSVIAAAVAWRSLVSKIIPGDVASIIEGSLPVVALMSIIGMVGVTAASRRFRQLPVKTGTLIIFAALLSFILFSNALTSRRSIDLVRRPPFELADVIGGQLQRECFDWIKENTPRAAIVASNMWRLPRSDDQKYFLVSLRSQRRVLIDGPEYVKDAGMVPRAQIERMKDEVDAAVQRPNLILLRALVDRGATILVVDRARTPDSRVDWFTTTVVRNSACSVHLLPVSA
jgi:hypothetical protein